MAVFKVFFQQDMDTRIIREDTQICYVEAETEEEVRKYLKSNKTNLKSIVILKIGKLLECIQTLVFLDLIQIDLAFNN